MLTRVLYNQGAQTIYFAPRDEHGRPSVATSPTYSIIDLRSPDGASDRTVQASASATVGSETETLTAAAGPSQADPTLITVTDASDFTEGREYLIHEEGQRESFVALRVDSTNNKIYSATDLRNSYTTAATVQAFELQGTFPGAEANDEDEVEDGGGPYQVNWVYTVNGVKYLTPEIVYITRYSVAPLITEADVLTADPTMARRSAGIVPIHFAIKAATEDFVGAVEAGGRDPAYFRTSNAGKLAVRLKTLEYLHRWMGREQDHANADRFEDRYQAHMANLLAGRPPVGTVEVNPAHDDAPSGSSMDYGQPLIQRS